jgi:hypothetical protein
MGLYCPHLVLIVFDRAGNLLEVQQRALQFMLEDNARGRATSIYDDRIDPQLKAWHQEIGLQPEMIAVKRFFVLEGDTGKAKNRWAREGIGIEDYPDHWFDILEHPDESSEDERNIVNEGIVRWEQEGMFVLWWGNDYWFDKTGECVAS